MSKHLATATAKTGIIEATFYTVFGKNTPDRNGRYRKAESPRPWSAVRTRLVESAGECIPCEQIKIASKKAAA